MHHIQTLDDTSWFPKWIQTDIFSKLNRERLRKVMEVSKRVHRWGNFALEDEVIKNITDLVNKNQYSDENVEQLLDRILDEFLHVNWKKYLNEKWLIKGALPNDGTVFEHTKNQTSLIRKYGRLDVKGWYILSTEYITLKLLALIHDIWELAIWDILYDDKTQNKELVEHQLWEKLLFSLFKKWVLSFEDKKLLEKIYEINFDKEHPLYKIFTNYEKLSYITGAISAYTHNHIINKPIPLVHNVLWNQIKPLLERIESPAIVGFLKDNLEEIDGMFDYVDNSWFQDESEKRNKMYAEAKKLWQSYKNTKV